MTEKTECLVSVVLPLADDGDLVGPVVRELHALLEERFTDHEIVLVDALSTDSTVERVEALLREVRYVRFIQLSGRVDRELACAAGMENAIGDIVVLFDLRGDPVELVARAVEKMREGTDVLVGTSPARASLMYRVFRKAFVKTMAGLVDYRIPEDATLFRAVSRRAAVSVLGGRRYRHHFFLDLSRTGYPTGALPYEQAHRRGRPPGKRPLAGLRKALSVLVFNSTHLLRIMGFLGLAGSVLGLLISAYSLLIHLIKKNVVEGWTTLTLFMSAQFILIFLILFLFGEYLARLVDEQREGREYGVRSEKHSSVMADGGRLNVTSDPTRKDIGAIQTGRDR